MESNLSHFAPKASLPLQTLTESKAVLGADAESRAAKVGFSRACVAMSVLLSSLMGASPASACWDGFYAQHEEITVYGGHADWSPDRARELALWVPRLQALIGPRGMDMYFDNADVDQLGSVDYPEGRYDVLFRKLARKLGASASEQRAAMSIAIAPLTIQIAATRDRARAEALVQRLMGGQSDAELDAIFGLHGFYEAGGFPADNPSMHVVEKLGDDGAPVYQVLVGAFLSRDQADQALAELRAALQVDGFVRRL